MKILVKAKTSAKEDKVLPPEISQGGLWPEKEGEEEWYIVSVKAAPVEGRANDAITKLLARHFDIPQSHIRLLRGANSKRKLFDILH